MKRELTSHPISYVILCLGLVIGVFGFFAAWPSHEWQRVAAVALALFYFLWGVAAHIHARRITRHIVAEYATAALLAGGCLFLITL